MNINIWQRSVLYIMLTEEMLASTRAHDSQLPIRLFVSRRALEAALWFNWQHRHTLHMAQLIKEGWVAAPYTSRPIEYTLTDIARDELSRVSVQFTRQARIEVPSMRLPF